MTSNQFMQEALQEALTFSTQNTGGPFGAVIVKNNQIIARGRNLVTLTNDPTAHAEIVAIRNACKTTNNFNLQGCEIYSSCEPCPMCLAAIYWSHLDKVYFACDRKDAAEIGFDDDFIYQEVPKKITERKTPFQKIIIENAKKPFIEWQNSTKKIRY